jgi:hypothetical protein
MLSSQLTKATKAGNSVRAPVLAELLHFRSRHGDDPGEQHEEISAAPQRYKPTETVENQIGPNLQNAPVAGPCGPAFQKSFEVAVVAVAELVNWPCHLFRV